jgi:hypothetical protein
MATKNHPRAEVTHRTVKTLLKEVSEQSRNYEKALKEFLHEKPGTESYEGSLGRVWAEAEVLATKAEHATMAIDQYTEVAPD